MTTDMQKRMEEAIQRTWETVADDIYAAASSWEGKVVTLGNAVDAATDYLRIYGDDPEAVEEVFALTVDARRELIEKTLRGNV